MEGDFTCSTLKELYKYNLRTDLANISFTREQIHKGIMK